MNKIRGARANTLVMDEVAQIPEEIINLVILPMMNVKQDPFDTSGRKNHLVMASSAYFQFNHLYDKYLSYKEKSNPNSPSYNPNYGLHLFDVYDMPDGWMDESIIAEAREQLTEIQFMMEYLCFKEDAIVKTTKGYKKISEVEVDDVVLTHTGSNKRVYELLSKEYKGDMVTIKATGTYRNITCTPNHPIYVLRGSEYQWIEAGNLKTTDMLVKVPFVTEKEESISIRDYLTIPNLFMKYDGDTYVYPTPSQFKGNSEEEQRKGLPVVKSALKDKIVIDKAFMRLAGYYLAEGCSSTNNQRALTFAFHANEREYIEQVKEDLYSVFGVMAKEYTNKNNKCTTVYVNSRVLANFFGNFLGKGHRSKFINEKLFGQDKELLKELVVSAFNGDGCLNNSREGRKPFASYYSTSEDLVWGISNVLNILGIASSVGEIGPQKGCIDGREFTGYGGYAVRMHGNNARKMFDICGVPYSKAEHREPSAVKHTGEHSLHRIKKISTEAHEGLVYNLEVEDDHSYTVSDFAVHNCLFPSESDGFFPAKLLNGAMKPSVEIELEGSKGSKYVFGIDPARTGDNFSLVVLKLGHPNKIVACYALNRKTFPEMHEFIREKIRDYSKNGGEIVRIHMDNGGGGLTIKDELANEFAWYNGEEGRWITDSAIIDMDDEEQQYLDGRRILKMQVFHPRMINSMNFDLKADLEKGRVVIPSQPQTEEDEEMKFRLIFDEIDAMVTETMTIVTTPQKSGFMHFDTPKQRMKKDRYSAFILACQGARELQKDWGSAPVKKLATGFARSSFLAG